MDTATDRIVFLSLGRLSRVMSVSPDGDDVRTLIEGLDSFPDGITIDPVNRHLYYTFMGADRAGEDYFSTDGYIERANYDGSGREIVVPIGTFVTGKQIQFGPSSRRIYWCDREGMKVMSCATDGSDLKIHVQTGATDEDSQDRRRHCVGVTVDEPGGYLYWTQKGKPKGNEGRILRAPLHASPGDDPARRTDIETLADGLPEPIDLEWDGGTQTLYWTDRGNAPKGNTLNRATIHGGKLTDHEILFSGLKEAIGLAYDHRNRRVFVSDLAGTLRVVNLDRPGEAKVVYQGRSPLTGIAYLPA
mgnify:CR=1 FL=1